MISITEGLLTFTFPATWSALKYDETAHYRHHFQSLSDSKAVDIVAISHEEERELWLIEVKDYRASPRVKGLDFYLEIQLKVRDTLAGLFMAAHRPEAADLFVLANKAAKRDVKVRVAVHLEQPKIVSKLRPAVTERVNHRQKLRQALRLIDSKAEMCEIAAMPSAVGWTVT